MKGKRSLCAVLSLSLLLGACAHRPGTKTQDPWTQWYQMQLPVELASTRVDKTHARNFARFRDAVQDQAYPQALKALEPSAKDPRAKGWTIVLKGQLAGLHTRACEQGQWLMLSPPEAKTKARLSMIELLDQLSGLVQSQDRALSSQAQTALARLLVIARDCPGSRIVQRRAETRLPVILASLADAQGPSLAPDLAYLWATLKLEREEWEKAQHWLNVARDQGLDDPRTTLALAQSHFGQKAYAKSEKLALASAKNIPEQMPQMRARAQTLAARSAHARGEPARARMLLSRALKTLAYETSALALAAELAVQEPQDCEEPLAATLAPIWGLSWEDPPELMWRLDELLRALDDQNADALRCLQAAVLWNIDEETRPALRGIRYFYAATIDARFGDAQGALGRALLARAEFESAGLKRRPVPVQALIEALQEHD